jgi:hypothetical protein
MSHSRIWKAPALVLLLVLIAAACSSSGGGSKADGDKAAFCKTNSDINAAIQKAKSPDDLLKVFKQFEGQFDSYVKNAPAEVKSSAELQVSKARGFIKDDDPSKLQQEDKELTSAGEKVDSFCGVKSSSSSSSASSSTGSDTESSTSEAKGSGASCAAFADIQAFTDLSAEVATKSWPEIQAAFAAQKDAVAAAYDAIAKTAPDNVAADVRKVAAFTEKLLVAAATAQSPQEWAQVVGSDPDAAEAGQAATRMSTFAQTECGIDPSAPNS